MNDWMSSGSVKHDSVLFVPATEGSRLVRDIKRIGEENRQGRRTRKKVVELTGKTVRDTLARNYLESSMLWF